MSDLGYVEKLLDGIEVEWKTLDDIVEFRRGSFPQPYGDSSWYDGKDSMPFVQVADVSDEGFLLHKRTKHQISVLAQPKSVFVETGTVIVSLQGTIGRVAITQYDCYIDRTLAIFTNYKADINKKYFAYQLKTKFDIEKKYARGSTLKTITKAEFSKFQIPIPPLNIQAKIVHILDTFTQLTAELTAELAARKQQYNYYRDRLFTFEEGKAVWKKLGDIAKKISSGGTPKTGIAEYWEDGTIPWMSSGEVNLKAVYKTEKYITESGLKNSSAKMVPKNSIVIALAGQGTTRGKVARTRIDLTTNQSLAYLTFDATQINPDYVFYFLETQYENLRQISSGSGTRGGLNLSLISNYEIPIPPLAEQERIVTILDKFDTLTISLTDGLPREIALRQQQYEYYRELLLNFPKAKVANHD